MSFNGDQVSVVVPAAGVGSRMNADQNKLFLRIRGIPILFRTLYRLNQFGVIDAIYLVCKTSDRDQIQAMFREFGQISKLSQIIDGGPERSDSVTRGLEKVLTTEHNGYVMTHDGARPFLSESLVIRLLEAVGTATVAIPTLKVFETVRKQDPKGTTTVIDRNLLHTVQTPQVFPVDQIQPCFLEKRNQSLNLTDEASYFEAAGKQVKLVEGEKWNIKLTTPNDMDWAEGLVGHYRELRLAGLDT